MLLNKISILQNSMVPLFLMGVFVLMCLDVFVQKKYIKRIYNTVYSWGSVIIDFLFCFYMFQYCLRF